MVKVIALLFVVLLALASAAGYLFLAEKIDAGEILLVDGQRDIDKGQLDLDAGKARLEAGKRELAEGKKKYAKAENNLFLVIADKLFKGGRGFKEAKEKIAEGDRQVARGEVKVKDGEKRLDAGELKMRQGEERLKLAVSARVAFAVGAVFFAFISIVMGFFWRRSLARIFIRSPRVKRG